MLPRASSAKWIKLELWETGKQMADDVARQGSANLVCKSTKKYNKKIKTAPVSLFYK